MSSMKVIQSVMLEKSTLLSQELRP